MGQQDIFGYEKDFKDEGQIISSQFAALSISGKVSLLQNVRGNYGREVRTMLESGSSNVFFVTGNSQGNVQASAAVGAKGFLASIKGQLNTGCGALKSVAVNLIDGRCTKSSNGLTFTGAHIRDYEFGFTTGADAVTEGFSMVVAGMSAI